MADFVTDLVALLLPNIAASVIAAPFERVKVIQQRIGVGAYSEADASLGALAEDVKKQKTPGAIAILRELYSRHGIRGLFNGLEAGLLHDCVSKILITPILSELSNIATDNILVNLLFGGIPNILAAILTHPLHIVHTIRCGDLAAGRKPTPFSSSLRQTFTWQRVRAGMGIHAGYIFAYRTCYLGLHEIMPLIFGNPKDLPGYLMMTLTAGFATTLLTYPLDTLLAKRIFESQAGERQVDDSQAVVATKSGLMSGSLLYTLRGLLRLLITLGMVLSSNG